LQRQVRSIQAARCVLKETSQRSLTARDPAQHLEELVKLDLFEQITVSPADDNPSRFPVAREANDGAWRLRVPKDILNASWIMRINWISTSGENLVLSASSILRSTGIFLCSP